jgi:hypothetical protein
MALGCFLYDGEAAVGTQSISRRKVFVGSGAALLSESVVAQPSPPLSPGQGGRSILPSLLQDGDVLLSTSPQPLSVLIRWVTNGPVSHAAVFLNYLGQPSIIEAQRPTLFIDSLDNAMARDTLLVAFRYPGISTDQQAALSAWFSGRQGAPFDRWGAVQDAIFQFLGAPVTVNVGRKAHPRKSAR